MSDPQPPVIEPVPDDGVSAVTVGLGIWAVATVLCLLLRDQLADHEVSWWLGTCVIGLGIGVFMRALVRERVRRADRQRLRGVRQRDVARGRPGRVTRVRLRRAFRGRCGPSETLALDPRARRFLTLAVLLGLILLTAVAALR